jgi:hypothetical protein
MKAIPIISVLALIVSLCAGFYAFQVSTQASEARINAIVDARLAARELKFVQAYAPKFREMFMAADEPEHGVDWNPKTLEELFAPIVKIVNGMTSDEK